MLSHALLVGLLAIASVYDVLARRAPNALVLSGVCLALVLNVLTQPQVGLLQSFLGGALGLLIFIYPYSKGFLGAGDVKLLMMVGVFLGPPLALWAFLFSCLAGGFVALAYAIYQTRLASSIKGLLQSNQRQMDLPYAVAILAGTTMAVFHLQRIISNA